MKKTMLLFCMSLFVSIGAQAHAPNKETEYRNCGGSKLPAVVLLDEIVDADVQISSLPVIHYAKIHTHLAGMSTAETKRQVVKADLDKEAGKVDWKTALIVLGVAFLVYLINKSKQQDID